MSITKLSIYKIKNMRKLTFNHNIYRLSIPSNLHFLPQPFSYQCIKYGFITVPTMMVNMRHFVMNNTTFFIQSSKAKPVFCVCLKQFISRDKKGFVHDDTILDSRYSPSFRNNKSNNNDNKNNIFQFRSNWDLWTFI